MRKILIIITSTLILLGIAGYILLAGKKPIIDVETLTSSSNDPIENIDSASPYQEMKMSIEEENNQNIERYNAAIKTKNPKLCDAITDENKKIECHDIIISAEAQKTGIIETCNTLTSTGMSLICRDNIRNDRAMTTRNKILCSKISDIGKKTFCEEGVDELVLKGYIESDTVTKEKCDELSSKFQVLCMTEIREIDESAIYTDAISKDDIEICKKISNQELQSTCIDTINLKKAISTQDNTLCETLTSAEKKLYCTNQVSKSSDIAIYKLATANNNIDNCTPITNESLRNKCHDTIIIATVKLNKDTSLCDTLTSTGMTKSCKQIGQ